jgi:organic hydroperoxide reductase OsmC/OhrA
MKREHRYDVRVTWTGNTGTGTSAYRDYARDHDVSAGDKPVIIGSADQAFRGDPKRWNPEELLVTSLAQCHMLSYLSLCAMAGVVVTDYVDDAAGTMAEDARDGGQFTEVTLRPRVTVRHEDMVDKARELHAEAHRLCYIARSVNFPVRHEPEILLAA